MEYPCVRHSAGVLHALKGSWARRSTEVCTQRTRAALPSLVCSSRLGECFLWNSSEPGTGWPLPNSFPEFLKAVSEGGHNHGGFLSDWRGRDSPSPGTWRLGDYRAPTGVFFPPATYRPCPAGSVCGV